MECGNQLDEVLSVSPGVVGSRSLEDFSTRPARL